MDPLPGVEYEPPGPFPWSEKEEEVPPPETTEASLAEVEGPPRPPNEDLPLSDIHPPLRQIVKEIRSAKAEIRSLRRQRRQLEQLVRSEKPSAIVMRAAGPVGAVFGAVALPTAVTLAVIAARGVGLPLMGQAMFDSVLGAAAILGGAAGWTYGEYRMFRERVGTSYGRFLAFTIDRLIDPSSQTMSSVVWNLYKRPDDVEYRMNAMPEAMQANRLKLMKAEQRREFYCRELGMYPDNALTPLQRSLKAEYMEMRRLQQ